MLLVPPLEGAWGELTGQVNRPALRFRRFPTARRAAAPRRRFHEKERTAVQGGPSVSAAWSRFAPDPKARPRKGLAVSLTCWMSHACDPKRPVDHPIGRDLGAHRHGSAVPDKGDRTLSQLEGDFTTGRSPESGRDPVPSGRAGVVRQFCVDLELFAYSRCISAELTRSGADYRLRSVSAGVRLSGNRNVGESV